MSDNVLTWLLTSYVLISGIQGVTVYAVVKILHTGRELVARREPDEDRRLLPMSSGRHP